MTRPVALPSGLAGLVLLSALSWAGPASAQSTVTVIQAENVRFDYAQVLRVTPVYQTLRATAVEQQCEEPPAAEGDSKLSRVVGAVKGAFSRDKDKEQAEQAGADCRPVTVEREFRRPIAYDVDYVYKGAKYRSRLPEDPGNRLRIRVSVTPVVPPPPRPR
ncbi:hypothetical protein [Vulcaniibacterium tengchongense]|uniref:Uncharacterized protein YcfJ n=1 Tax=Vulcaniibacterium tengchongense TaxID=1273429 RepID=A0A3N4VKT6_9GAMM|nr:hypothetical protein [Vulcaniibacterium tengchongense]RPE82035.1 uncharacterized protein YcfJ [Vulcaniibacterium tengchongense]